MKRSLSYLLFLVLAGCGSCDNEPDVAPSPVEDGTYPTVGIVAVAGDDFTARAGELSVALDGSMSADPAGGTLTYLWEQTAGALVTISNSTSATASFNAPGAAGTLTFRLTVTGPSGSSTDAVDVTVKTVKVTPAAGDAWFLGYGQTGPINLTMSVDGSGTYTYEWTGLEPWMRVSGGTTSTTLTLSGTPGITELQEFMDRAEVAVLSGRGQGRAQLKFKATDTGTGDFDEAYLNLSVGPHSNGVMGGNVPLGEPVLLNGSAGSSWRWSGTNPDGTTLSFLKPDKTPLAGATNQRFVYFVPGQVGKHEISLLVNGVARVITVVCGRYVGAGNIVAEADWTKGECAACHVQMGWAPDMVGPWLQTKHATAWSRLLDSADPLYSASQAKGRWQDAFDFGSSLSIDHRTVGWSAITTGTNNGWAANAMAEGYAFRGTTWEQLKSRYRNTAALSNVQCESCHGPGSEHKGGADFIRKSYDEALCGRCHAETLDDWQGSPHGFARTPWHSVNTYCNGCHTAQGFAAQMRTLEGVNPLPVFTAEGNPARPSLGGENFGGEVCEGCHVDLYGDIYLSPGERRPPNCQACHDPHKKGSGGSQLRASGRVQFRNDAIATVGDAATCYLCHQSHVDTRIDSADTAKRRGPHRTTAAEMLEGVNGQEFDATDWSNGYAGSAHGDQTAFIVSGQSTNRKCLACHADAAPGSGTSGYGAVGGHTFSVKHGGTGSWTNATNGNGTTIAGTKKFFVGSGPSFKRVIPASNWYNYPDQMRVIAVAPGDTLTITAGADVGTYTIVSVDGARQVTVSAGSNFGGGAVTAWSITSEYKFNVASCLQCHDSGDFLSGDFGFAARGDYDGDGTPRTVQEEMNGLLSILETSVNAKIVALKGANRALVPTSGSAQSSQDECRMCHLGDMGPVGKTVDTMVAYYNSGNEVWYPFPGQDVTNAEVSWSSLTSGEQADWIALYKAAYNYYFVVYDGSGGVHNTGYAVNLLQSSIKKIDPTNPRISSWTAFTP